MAVQQQLGQAMGQLNSLRHELRSKADLRQGGCAFARSGLLHPLNATHIAPIRVALSDRIHRRLGDLMSADEVSAHNESILRAGGAAAPLLGAAQHEVAERPATSSAPTPVASGAGNGVLQACCAAQHHALEH